MIVRIDENKAYRHGGLYTSGRGQLMFFFTIQTQTPTGFPIINHIYEKKFLSIQKHYFSTVFSRKQPVTKG